MKKFVSLLVLCSLMLVCLSACGNNDAPGATNTTDQAITLRISHVLQEDHPTHKTLVDIFKPEIESNSDGRIKVEIYPNAQLGSDRQAIEAVSLGTLEMSVPGGPVLSGFYEPYMVYDLPFLFDDRQAVYKAMDGELKDKLAEGLLEQDIIILGIGENGFRHVTNNTGPIYEPADMKGLKIRTMENPLHMAAFSNFGANPTPMAFGELFTALQQKTVDAQENPVAIIRSSRFEEVQKYLSLTGHVYANCPYIVNKGFWEGLDDSLKQVVQAAVDKTVVAQRDMLASMEDELIEQLKQAGMEVNELTAEQKKVFADLSQPAYDIFVEKFGNELIELARSYNQ